MRPSLKIDFCKDRRFELLKQLPDSSVVIIFGAKEVMRNADVNYPFRQDSDFWYFTGFDEPDAVLVLSKNGTNISQNIFLNEKNQAEEIWNGFRLGTEAAPKFLKLDNAYSNQYLDQKMPELLLGFENIFTSFEDEKKLAQIGSWRTTSLGGRNANQVPQAIFNLKEQSAKMRLFKTSYEIELMQKASNISARAHKKAMEYSAKNIAAGVWEYQLQGVLEAEFIQSGSGGSAYSSIVAAGKNACVLHYVENSAKIAPKDLVLIDAGCEYSGYASDITRTFPADGKFSKEAQAIYELVLAANKEGIKMSKPGKTLAQIHKHTIRFLTQGLIDLKILAGNLDDLIYEQKYHQFFMHGTGHWLGLDVHDSGAYKHKGKDISLAAGMTFTIEPGLYFLPHKNLAEKWHNLGVRVEDDILIEEDSYKVLTDSVPKEVKEIEALMSEAKAKKS